MSLKCSVLVTAMVGVCAASNFAGPLNPPPGPIAPSHKTLTELEPRIPINDTTTPGDADSIYRITQPGSYYLTGNITVNVAHAAIEIAASHVTIDLQGFSIRGDRNPLQGMPGISLDGVRTVDAADGTGAPITNITIRNGVIADFGGSGVQFTHQQENRTMLIEGVQSARNGVHGITANGAVIRDCIALGNIQDGISAGDNSTIENCVAHVNGGADIRGGQAAAIRGCATASGLGGIVVGPRSLVIDCTADGAGITAEEGSRITGCIARAAIGTGISTAKGCTIERCTVRQAFTDGIVAGDGSRIIDCTVDLCGADGIEVGGNCLVRGNSSNTNGTTFPGAGIRITGTNNRIEANNCGGSNFGIVAIHGNNFIVRNTCGLNATNWSIAAGNHCLVVQPSGNPGAINGDSGGEAPGGAGTDPNANFTH